MDCDKYKGLMCEICKNENNMFANLTHMLNNLPRQIHLRRDIAETAEALAKFYYDSFNRIYVPSNVKGNIKRLCEYLSSYTSDKTNFINTNKKDMRLFIELDSNGEPIYDSELVNTQYYSQPFDTYKLLEIINAFWNIKKSHSIKLKILNKLFSLNIFSPFLCSSPNGKIVDCLI